MVEEIDSRLSLSVRVKEALLSVPREAFVPSDMSRIAYHLDALPIGAEQFISSPLTVAKMSEYLESESCGSVLEIGCGSGYQAAVLSFLFRRVFSIERIERLRREANERFRALKLNINTRFSDGNEGWEAFAPFERILFSAATHEISPKIAAQLAEGGILVAPIIAKNGAQFIARYVKKRGLLELLDTKGECAFVLVQSDVVG